MWRFIRDMQVGDLVVVLYGPSFYVAEVTGPPIYIKSKVDDDTAFRRKCDTAGSLGSPSHEIGPELPYIRA